MKRLFNAALGSLLTLSVVSGCAQQAAFQPVIPQVNQVSSLNTIENQYIITAQALIDKMPKANPADYPKIVKDFTRELKTLNRYALNGLIKYAVNTLHENVKPGQNPMESPVIHLVYPILDRLLDVYEGLSLGAGQVFVIAIEKDAQRQEKLITDFSKYIKKLPKVDLKNLINIINGQNSNMDEYLPPNSPLAKRLIKILEARLAV